MEQVKIQTIWTVFEKWMRRRTYFFPLAMINCIEQEGVQVTVWKQLTSSVDNGQQAVSAPHLSKLQYRSLQQENLLQSLLVRMLPSAKTEKSLKLHKQK